MTDTTVPLHGGYLFSGQYYACQEPEQPYSHGLTCFDLRCHRCRIAAQATLRTNDDVTIPFHDTLTGEDRPRSLTEVLALAEQRYGQ